MTLPEWLATRTPAPPPALAVRLRSMAEASAGGADRGGADRGDAARADALVAAAEGALIELLRAACLTRDHALDLLAIDALVTYAFEAAASQPAGIEDRASRALARIAACAAPYDW